MRLAILAPHIECYTKVPAKNHYTTDTVLLDCTKVMPCLKDIEPLDITGKSLVLFTGNLADNSYGTPEYGKTDTALCHEILEAILLKQPAFIVIDSYGIGAHGEEHINFDKLWEVNHYPSRVKARELRYQDAGVYQHLRQDIKLTF